MTPAESPIDNPPQNQSDLIPLIAPVAGYLTGLFAASLLVSIWVAALGPKGVGPKLVSSVGLWVGFVGAPLFVARRAGIRWPLRVQPARRLWSDLAHGLPVGIALQLIAIPGLYWAISRMTGPLNIDGAARELTGGVSGGSWVFVILVAGIGAPIAEEIFFRGLLLSTIQQRLGTLVAVALSSTVFAASHFQIVQFPGLLLAGVIFAVLATRSQHLGPSIWCHVGFNMTTIVMLMTR
ncbi:MAG: type II CAAX endopeptidase family protein [Acidimicrobiales bacterium]